MITGNTSDASMVEKLHFSSTIYSIPILKNKPQHRNRMG
jgi:hypothetical protein